MHITFQTSLAVDSEKVLVGPGDGIWQLCRTVYGTVDAETVRLVMDFNPHIQNPNELAVGDEIVFPRLAMAEKTVASAATGATPES
jgi:phage tail protein X